MEIHIHLFHYRHNMVTNHLAQNENVVLIKLHTYVLHYGMQWQQLKKHRKLQKKKKKKKRAHRINIPLLNYGKGGGAVNEAPYFSRELILHILQVMLRRKAIAKQGGFQCRRRWRRRNRTPTV